MKPEFQCFALRHTLSCCQDFATEKSAMEKLVEDLTVSNSSVEILVTPKYHCELASQGIEYGWSFAFFLNRSLPQAD